MKTPLFVWAYYDEIVVDNEINAQKIENDAYYGMAPNVGVINLNFGSHCAFSAAYGFEATAVVLRTYVIEHSPEFYELYKERQMEWSFGFPEIPSLSVHLGQSWKFQPDEDKVEVTFRMADKLGETCSFREESSSKCVIVQKYKIPISSLKAMGARIPRNEIEAQALNREFNGKVQFFSKGQNINGTHSSDFVLKWRDLFD